MTLGIGVVGLGRMGQVYATHVARTAQGVQLVGFCSSNTEDSWPNHGRWSWRGWLSVAVGDQVGRQPVTVNCGIAGDTSTGLQAHGERDVQSLDPMLVVVTIGGNDQR